METLPNKTKEGEVDEKDIKETAKKSALEKVKQKVSIVNIEEIAEAEAHKAADAHMTESTGKAGFFKKMWKHTFFDEYYRQKEMNKVREDIKNTGDIYTARLNNDRASHEKAMKGISERFVSDYEGTLSEGEEKKILNETEPEAKTAKTDIKNLIVEYAKGTLNDEAFANEKIRILNNLKNQDLLKGASNYADNLLEIAKNAKLAIEHGAKVEELELDTDIIIGKAKSSLKTEAHFNKIDKLVEKMKTSHVGRFISPAVLSTSIGLAYSISIGAGTKIMRTKAAAYGSLGAAVALSSVFSGINESHRVTDERKQHGLEMAEGGTFKEGDKRREQMNKYQYQMESSNELAESLRSLTFEKNKEGKDVPKEIKQEDIDKILANLANIEARNSLNSKNKIDLISYSNIGNVEKERTDLTILSAKTKVELRKKMGDEAFKKALEEQTKIVEDSLLGGEKGINENDKDFSKYKTKRVAIKMLATIVIGFTVGAVVQEGVAFAKDHIQGALETVLGVEGYHNIIQTPVEYLRGVVSGHPSHMSMHDSINFNSNGHEFKLPEGVSLTQNTDGTFDILRGDKVISDNITLNFDSSGGLDAESIARLGHDGIVASATCATINSAHEINSSAEEYLKNHPGANHIARDGWYDNNTPKPIFDQNELKLQWGGDAGSPGIVNGNYVMNVSHMTSDGSFSHEFSVDAQEKIKSGGLKMALSLTQGTQHQVFEVPIDTNGNAIIDPNSEIGKLFFANENGHAVFKGRFAEVVESFGPKDGVEHVKTLATLVGQGNDSIPDVIPLPVEISVNNLDIPLDTEPPYFIPIIARNPLEPITNDKKPKGESEEINERYISSEKPLEGNDMISIEKTKPEMKAIGQFSEDNKFGIIDAKMEHRKAKIDLVSTSNEIEVFKSTHPNEKIPTELEDKLNKAEVNVESTKNKLDEIEKKNTEVKAQEIKNKKGRPVVVKKNQKQTNNANKLLTPRPNLSPNNRVKQEAKTGVNEGGFTSADLSKIGTEFESANGSYKVSKIIKEGGFMGLFKKTRIEVIFKDKKGIETLVSYDKKGLEDELKKGRVRITKVEAEK